MQVILIMQQVQYTWVCMLFHDFTGQLTLSLLDRPLCYFTVLMPDDFTHQGKASVGGEGLTGLFDHLSSLNRPLVILLYLTPNNFTCQGRALGWKGLLTIK